MPAVANGVKPQPKWRRTSTSRSKKGCATCKRRRLKCDERQPACLRCSTAGFSCDGYITPATPLKLPTSRTPRNILPKDSQNAGLPRRYPSDVTLSRTEAEDSYLRLFQHKTKSGFEGMMDWSIWNPLILQLSHREPFIRDSVIAIGALSKALDVGGSSSETQKIARMHGEFALMKYGKAVKAMKTVLVTSELREVLTACLLVYCFEVLLNNRHLALSHVISGHHLLREWLTRYNRARPGNHRLLSPAPITIDDEIVESFERIDLQISTIYDPRPLQLHRDTILEGLSKVQRMPPTFGDLTEARGYLIVVMRRSNHFLATTWPSSQASSLFRDFELLPPDNLIVKTGTNIYGTSCNVSPAIREEQREFAEDISRWSRAFQHLYQRTRRPEVAGFRDYVVGTLLRIHAISTTIIVAGVLFTEESSYDTFLSQFDELLTLSTIIVDAYNKKSGKLPAEAGFFLDLGITSPLFLLVARCRDHVIRNKAIELLRGWHVESCWQPRLIAGIGAFLMEIEENGNIDAAIPENRRAVLSAVCEEPQQSCRREALVQCVQRHGGPDGEPVWHERRVSYRRNWNIT